MPRSTSTPSRPLESPRAGLSLLELLVAITFLTVALGGLTKTLISVSRLTPVHRETALAVEGARSLLEELASTPFDELFARYNDDPADDPDGPGTAPGPGFAVVGLRARPADPDGLPGRIVLPTNPAGELREDLDLRELGMPRDLDLDGAVDGADHGADYSVLPVCLRIEWVGVGGERVLDHVTSFTQP